MTDHPEKWAALALLVTACQPAAPEKYTPGKSAVDSFAAERAFVRANVKDPGSAKFGPLERGKPGSVCGLVNARNGFGGLTGMRPFVATPAAAVSGDRLYVYDGVGTWSQRGIMAEIFAERGCSIGADQAKALEVRRSLARMSGK